MKNTTSRTRRLLLSKNFILMVVMLVVIIIAISAWFTVNRTVTANNINVTAASSKVQIAKVLDNGGPGEFSDHIEFTGSYVFNKDCTGDGQTLIVPEFNVTKDSEAVRKSGGKEVNENQSGSTAKEFSQATEEDPEFHYFQFQFFIRSTSSSVYLDDSSILLSSMEKNGNSLFVSGQTGNVSDYGNYSDGLVGAMRVSLIAQACNSAKQTWVRDEHNELVISTNTTDTYANPNAAERQILWDPRPDVHLNIPDTPGKITDWSLTQVQSFNNYTPGYYKNKTGTGDQGLDYITNDQKLKVSTVFKSYSNSLTLPFLNGSVDISTFTNRNGYRYNDQGVESGNGKVQLPPDENGGLEDYYLTKYTMNVWIEGTDNEARRAMDGGAFDLTLKFK